MTQPVQTHINAYYAELITAKQQKAVADQRVVELEQEIIGRGGELPNNEIPQPEPVHEDIATSDDTSAAEAFTADDNETKKGKK